MAGMNLPYDPFDLIYADPPLHFDTSSPYPRPVEALEWQPRVADNAGRAS